MKRYANMWCCRGMICFVLLINRVISVTVEEKLSQDLDLSEFYSMLERNVLANVTLQLKQVTVFAPINEAFQRYEKKHEDHQLVLYHMANVAKTTNLLESLTSLNSELPGNPPLWITKTSEPYHEDIYVNNAKLLLSQSNFQATSGGNTQVLHKIDEVLVPIMSPPTAKDPLYNPTALEFLQKFESLSLTYRFRVFRQRVEELQQEDVFRKDGGNTFFIPIDEGFKNPIRPDLIDKKVIDCHVIPDHVLFTAPTPKDHPYSSGAAVDNIKVQIKFSEDAFGKKKTFYVKSNTLINDPKHPAGVVIAEIKKANIPVKNGVIHLIHKPLMVVHNTVKELLEQDKEDGPLSKFYEAIKDAGDIGRHFLRAIEHSPNVTLFAPSNEAWNDGNLNNLLRNPDQIQQILNMHLVVDNRLTVQQIIANNQKHVYQAPTINNRKNLYFNVVEVGKKQTLTVEGGGVNATVIQENIAATNGIIHIIDRVLGVPYTTVLDKLRTDPMLNETYHLGIQDGFNQQLNDTTKKFTYFVPRDRAWLDAKVALPSAIKKLFMKDFPYLARPILERHLVIADIPYTMERIKQLSNGTYGPFQQKKEIELTTPRGGFLRLYVEERVDRTFVINWQGEKIPVFRPNVECTNGIIHVIDAPFIKEGDIQVRDGGASGLTLAPHLLMIMATKWFLL